MQLSRLQPNRMNEGLILLILSAGAALTKRPIYMASSDSGTIQYRGAKPVPDELVRIRRRRVARAHLKAFNSGIWRTFCAHSQSCRRFPSSRVAGLREYLYPKFLAASTPWRPILGQDRASARRQPLAVGHAKLVDINDRLQVRFLLRDILNAPMLASSATTLEVRSVLAGIEDRVELIF